MCAWKKATKYRNVVTDFSSFSHISMKNLCVITIILSQNFFQSSFLTNTHLYKLQFSGMFPGKGCKNAPVITIVVCVPVITEQFSKFCKGVS